MSATARILCYSVSAASAAVLPTIISTPVIDLRGWIIIAISGIGAAAAAAIAYADKGPAK
jgi:hypothetical protein